MADMLLEEIICATAELTGTNLTPASARLMSADLARYPEKQVLGALKRCRMELKGRLSVAEIVTRLDDGRPTADEAWAMYPHNEEASAILNNEICGAMEHAAMLLNEGDKVGARLAFRDAYNKRVQQAREIGEAPKWHVSLGTDKASRPDVVLDAVQKGFISQDRATAMLPTEFHPKILEHVRKELALSVSKGRGVKVPQIVEG